ncbi:SH3 domain-containing protein [Pantoea dispersa]|uniref:SH3 domain-containing protein n=1 Tax=Pantoea dispersa TaxID=59814 RepID=UPI0039BE120A
MTENEKPEKSLPDDHPVPLRTLTSLKSARQLAALNGFTGNAKLSGSTNNAILPKHVFPESVLSNFFHNEAALKAVTESTSFSAISTMQKQTDFFKSLASITESPFFKVMEKFRTVTDLYKIQPPPSTLAIAEEQMKKNAELLNAMAKEAGNIPRTIASHILSHELLNQSHRSYFHSEWEKISQRSIAAVSFREQSLALEAINKLFAEDRSSFNYLTENIINSLENHPDDEAEEVRKQVRTASKFSDYPPVIKIIIIYLLTHLFSDPLTEMTNEIIINYIKQQCYTEFLCEPRKEQVKILTANRPDELTYQDLNRIRVVRRDNVRLRVAPSMQAGVIEVLPVNQPLVIINRDNRMWLLVRTVLNGEEIEGWINRSYTQVLIK